MKTWPNRKAQQGATLIFVLILLVVLLLGGLSVVRTVDTGVLISGNLAFKRSTTYSADYGIEAARQWLLSRGNENLTTSDPDQGYYASRQDSITDFVNQVNWDHKIGGPTVRAFDAGQDSAGNSVAYIVHRLCFQDGEPNTVSPPNPCESATAGGAGGGGTGTQAGYGYGGGRITGGAGSSYLYRITVRVSGPRGTRSYVQSVLLL